MDSKQPSFAGEVMLLDWSETAKGGAKIVLQLDGPGALEPFRTMTLAKRGTAGQRLMAVMVEIAEDELPKTADARYVETGEATQDFLNRMARASLDKVATVEAKPFGKQASELYRTGFFFVPSVLEAIGTDDDFLEWIKSLECCVRGSLIADKAHEGDIVPAHVRRIAHGAGTGIKPRYSAVSMCNKHHQLQHQHGESEVGGKDHLDNLRNKNVVEWASTRLAAHFNQPSMGYVAPSDLKQWAIDHDVVYYLPAAYK